MGWCNGMARADSEGRNSGRPWVNSAADRSADRAARARELLAAQAAKKAALRVHRPSFAQPVLSRYAVDLSGEGAWRRPDAALSAVEAILDAVADGQDRSLLSWPRRCCDGALAAAFGLREARATGRLAHAAFAVWPWRPHIEASHGSMAPVRSVHLHPADAALVGSRVADAVQQRAPWTVSDGMAHYEAAMVEMRLRDLLRDGASGGRDIARSPTLRELTPAFSPLPGDGLPYSEAPSQILQRVLTFTLAGRGDKGLNLREAIAAVGNPLRSPHALFGLPLTTEARLSGLLRFERFRRFGVDAVVVNLTGAIARDNRDAWEKGLVALLAALAQAPVRRPPVVLLADDPHVHRHADSVLREAASRGRRLLPARRGVYCPVHRPVGDAAVVPNNLQPLRVQADIKDAGLAPLRRRLLALARLHREAGDGEAARASRVALEALHRAASMPIGLAAAEEAARILWNGDSEQDLRAVELFLPGQACKRMESRARAVGRGVEDAATLCAEMLTRMESWREKTPVSAKLTAMLTDPAWNARDVLVSLPHPRVADVLMAAAPMPILADVDDHRALEDGRPFRRLILVAPTPDAVRSLLVIPHAPELVVVLGDCAGIGLVSSLLRCLGTLDGMGPLASRARYLAERMAFGGADASLDTAEAEFRLAPDPSSEILDFTRGGEAFRGEVAVIRLRRGDTVKHRANALVPAYFPDEVRPFRLVQARSLSAGDMFPVFREGLRSLLRSAIASSGKTAMLIRGYHAFIASARDRLPGVDISAKATEVVGRMGGAGRGEEGNVRRWLRADLDAARLPDLTRARPNAARDWPRFRAFMAALGVDAAGALAFWRTMIVPTRSFSIQEGALFHEQLAAFLIDPEGAASLARGHSADDLIEAVREAVDVVASVSITRGDGTA